MNGLYSILKDLTTKDPFAPIFLECIQDDYVAVSRGEFLRETDAIAALLRAQGISSGDCVATWLPNWSTVVAWQFAASAVGAHVIGINTRYNLAEVGHVLRKARPKVIAMAHGFQRLDLLGKAKAALLEIALEEIPAVVPVAGPGNGRVPQPQSYDLGGGVWSTDGAAERAAVAPLPAPARTGSGADLAVAFTTSGSTGMPKLAAHSEFGVIHHAFADASGMDLQERDVMVAAVPFSGVYGFNLVLATIVSGAVTLLHPVFNEHELVAAMAKYKVTHFTGADDMLTRMKTAWYDNPVDLSAWRRIHMADFLGRTHEIAQWAQDEFGTIAAGVYGSSELFGLLAFWPPETELPRRWNGGGIPVSTDIKARVADPFTGEVLESGEGELQFQGPNAVDAYLGDEGEGAKAFTEDGWFQSGDFGTLTDDGGFVYICRAGDVLRLRGFLVEPAEIERRLGEHPAVHTAKVVGLRDNEGETVAIGFVTLTAGGEWPTGDDLRAWCRESLARFKVPAVIHVIEEMPTTVGTNGSKIRVATLREWAQERITS
ncbi:AMP-binding protein [Glaciibacter superstes]|uniref:AMP-binding protein n=1 Tax=Glaciibacter superstes TaxID=501023 RepID=UPI000414C4B4|nr:AMP-binding protein [Glaciibacter superstes]